MFNPSHITFFTFIMFSILLVGSSNSWLIAWVGIELNTLCFIPFMFFYKTGREGEAAIKYFLIQTMASVILLISVLGSKCSSLALFSSLLLIALLIKIGAAPFHSWVVAVGENLNWFSLYLMLTLQKINPLILLTSSNCTWNLMTSMIIASSVIGAIMGLSHTNLRKILIFSSINHLGWLLASISGGMTLLSIYFLSYCFLLFPIIFTFTKTNLNYLNQTPSIPINSQYSLMLAPIMLSLGGLPPFFGFYPKWIVINQLISSGNTLSCFIMVLMSLFTLYYYLRITYSSFILTKLVTEPRWNMSFSSVSMVSTLIFSLLGLILIFMC